VLISKPKKYLPGIILPFYGCKKQIFGHFVKEKIYFFIQKYDDKILVCIPL